MIRLPVWELGLTILAPMAAAFGVRGLLEKRLVDSAPPIRQSVMQFRLELGLFFAAGMVTALILLIGYHFPLLQSGMKLVLGIFTVGLFAGLDLALARERQVIHEALAGPASYEPPIRLTPMTRTFSFIATCILLLITAIILLVIVRDVNWLATQELNMDTIGFLSRSVLTEILFVMGFLLVMVINLIFSYARNLRMLFDTETLVLEKVSTGDLTRKVPVTTSNELGVIAGHTNTMISSLREGVRMREGLLIAKEVQQHFLPAQAPEVPGLDIAGASLFSDETGGDFYDFIDCETDACSGMAVVVGDVSGHGIGAALLMASARAIIRQNAATRGSATDNISRANKHLAMDLSETGRFLTLFFMSIHHVIDEVAWINAGHQPPLLYSPDTDDFTELKGNDIPLGVEETWQYTEHRMSLPAPGQILLIGTDGAWEARNPSGEMFGTERIAEIVRENRDQSAREIMDAVCDTVLQFADRDQQEDDLTLVVIKGVEQ